LLLNKLSFTFTITVLPFRLKQHNQMSYTCSHEKYSTQLHVFALANIIRCTVLIDNV